MLNILDEINNIRMKEIEQDEKKSLLQPREAELSSLEAEEKTILEAEVLIYKQKEGQDIGE